MAGDKNHQNEEQRQVLPVCPVNKNGKQSQNTQLETALAIVDRLVLSGDVQGMEESLVELKNLLLRETIQIQDDKQKMRELTDENRRLRQQVTNLERDCSSHTDNTERQDRLATCNQTANNRKNDKKSTKKNRIAQPAKTLTEETNGELDNSVLQDDNLEDTIALARKARQAQGLRECEFTCGGEGDLHKHLNECTINPGHVQFVPVGEFSKHHLPHGHQDDDLVKCIQALADITVRIIVTYDHQTETGSTKKRKKTGSGWILIVKIYPIWHNQNKDCPCPECKNSESPKKEFAEILVYTAGHVVEDARNITCCLFFDRGGTPDDCERVESFSGTFHVVGDTNGHTDSDRCQITFLTHDLILADKLDKLVKRYRNLHAKVSSKNWNEVTTVQEQQGESGNKSKLTIIVSHPHGCSKQVTVGYYTRREELREGRDVTRYFYTTPTCPGSSGAPVYIIGKPAWSMCEHPHHGKIADNSKENRSGYGFF